MRRVTLMVEYELVEGAPPPTSETWEKIIGYSSHHILSRVNIEVQEDVTWP